MILKLVLLKVVIRMIKAKYTVVLKTLLDDDNVKPLIDKALSTYPMYKPINNSNYSIIPTRDELNKKILNHFKYREIGFETIGRFLDELEIAMNEIMPYYYQLYKSADILNDIKDPFGNVDIVETYEEETRGVASGTSSGQTNSNAESSTTTNSDMNSKGRNVKSDTPQGDLNMNEDSINYASEVNWDENSSNSKGTTTGNDKTNATSSGTTRQETTGTNTHTFTKQGNQGVNTYAHDMKELREILVNIELMILNDKKLNECFMLVY